MSSEESILKFLIVLLAILAVSFLYAKEHVSNVSAIIPSGNVGIYWDQNCNQKVSSIGWGVLSPGQTRTITLYVRNELNHSIRLLEQAVNWNPANASQLLRFSWQCQEIKIISNAITKVTQTLFVSHETRGLASFSFNILFQAEKYLMTDLDNNDVVNIFDVRIVARALYSTPQSPQWDPRADLDKNGVVNLFDVAIVARDFGKT